MSSAHPRGPRSTGTMIAGLLAIPFGAVTSVAIAADVASTTDPAAARGGVLAVVVGAAVGAAARRAGRATARGVATVVAHLFVALVPTGVPADAPVRTFSLIPAASPTPAFVPASTGRRGPPSVR